ncbi:hypothetical protein B1748_00620 [Paenibacillus sp. MY03]|uniref:YIP1 family protein n=1 Tax=Paenibacillus sp. MY03 TaxID=302980 RepID=UPI000B3C3992|nr:YIP1 family protein [Paenibacillus sp. MY03]OUS78613.1 hypothetical protein B1748_00620 [Paenibacillus sp. MY03]
MPTARRLIGLIGILCLLCPAPAFASLPYWTEYFIPDQHDVWETQPVYTPVVAMTGKGKEGQPAFSEPNDLFISHNDQVYVADTGNNRIVILNPDGDFARQIAPEDGEGKLSKPEGVFVTGDGTVYVADTGNQRIAVFDNEGSFLKEYRKPVMELLPDSYFFVPRKIVVDTRGTLYIVSAGSYQGIVRMNANGDFTGFFGANRSTITFTQWMQRQILSAEQLARVTAVRPGESSNITPVSDGFLLTANSGVNSGQIKKLNAGGVDMLKNRSFQNLDQLVDVAMDANGFMYAVYRHSDGAINIYDPQGQALFRFGGISTDSERLGLFSFPTSIALNSRQELWVADSKLNIVQIFERTEFGDSVLRAMDLYDKGYYTDGQSHWEQAIALNEMLDAGYRGLGKAALKEGDYDEALTYFKQGTDPEGYSDAFWEVRLDWIQKNLLQAIAIIAMIWAASAFSLRRQATKQWWKRITERPQIQTYVQEWGDFRYLLLHPYEGFYRLKERRISMVTLMTIMLGVILLTIGRTYWTGFSFDPTPLELRDPIWPILIVLGGWLTWAVANYLVSTVKDGEGRFREVMQASTFAFVPYITFMPIYLVLTNVIVLEERVVADSLLTVMWMWIAMLMLVMTQVIHNFDFMEAIRNSAVTLLTIGVIWIMLTILTALGYNVYNFVYEFSREVIQYG